MTAGANLVHQRGQRHQEEPGVGGFVERQVLRRVAVSYEEWEVLFRGLLVVRVAALSADSGAAGRQPVDGWTQRALAPIAVALVREALAGPRVRAALDRLTARLLGGAGEAPRATGQEPGRRAA